METLSEIIWNWLEIIFVLNNLAISMVFKHALPYSQTATKKNQQMAFKRSKNTLITTGQWNALILQQAI